MTVNSRVNRLKLNIVFSLVCQIVILLCNLIIPYLIIYTYGSEAYGATTSITRFLAYIALLEGGITGVARAALYKPLAENDMQRISEIITEIKKFFRIIGCIFAVYIIVLACSFKYISHAENFDWFFTFSLVIVMGIATFAQSFIGIHYNILLDAAQKTYITKIGMIFAWILLTFGVVILTTKGYSLVLVKLVTSIAFLLYPLVMWLYVRKHYKLVKCDTKGKNLLSQKWDGFGQHLAYVIHFQTDVVLLTIFTNLSLVAVYSVYNMIIGYMQNILGAFTSGMEALFGEMLAKEEHDALGKTFDFYETMISIVVIALFSVTAVMITPFIKLYTVGITDANYMQPFFAVILTLAAVLYCLRLPYHGVTIAAGHFKQTNKAAYGEAAINIILSIALLRPFGLCGIAVATLIATGFRFLYYVLYLSKNIICRSKRIFVKRQIINGLSFGIILICGFSLINHVTIINYIYWAFYAVIITGIAGVIVLLANFLFYRETLLSVLERAFKKVAHR